MNTDVEMDDWQIELQNLMEMFERESTISLRKINRYFVTLGRPFDERFRKHFLKQSKVRLKMSFDTILYEQHGENSVQVAPNSSVQIDGNDIVNSTGNSSGLGKHLVDNADSLNLSCENGVFLEMKMKNNIDPAIEIVDSDDEGRSEEQSEIQTADEISPNQMETNTLEQFNSDNVKLDVEDVDTELNNRNAVENYVKLEVKVESENEIGVEDLPLVEFDPVKENEKNSVDRGTIDVESLGNQSQTGSSSNIKKQKKKRAASNIFKCKDCSYATRRKGHFNRHLPIHDTNAVKPFKCKHCDYASRFKDDLNRHQRLHADQKLIGVARDSTSGLYKCTHCTRNFPTFRAFSVHLTKSHKNNERLFNCVHCLRAFSQKTEKNEHEMQCENRRYECHLCKNYVTGRFDSLQKHMRTHSGVKPFQCAICSKFFQQKGDLKRHLNSIHTRISK